MSLQELSPRAVIGEFFDRLEVGMGQTWVDQLSVRFDSDQGSEDLPFLGMVPRLREMVNGHRPDELSADKITIVNKEYEASLRVPVKDWRRDKTGQIMARVGELADAAVAHWRSLVSALITAGTATACYDGQYFFSASHTEGESGTQSNLITASDASALNVGTAAAPTAYEFAEAVKAVIPLFYGLKDDKGEYLNEEAKAFTVMVPLNLSNAANAAVQSQILNTGSGAVDNTINKGEYRVSVVTNPRLTSGAVFYVFRSDGRVKPFVRIEEVPIEADQLGPGSEYAKLNKEYLFLLYTSRGAGYGRWQHAMHCTLS